MRSSIRRIAIREASKSNATNYKVAAVIHDGPRVFCKAHNIIRKTHTRGSGPLCSCHAEVRAIMRAKRILNGVLEGVSIFIARINQNGDIKPSKPCPDCEKLIEEHGMIARWT